VLLLEAGGQNDEVETQRLADRYSTFVTAPGYNWNYITAPQKQLENRELYYPRGKGLGGSSAINFAFYSRGPKDDFDEWARQVGDDFYKYENALPLLKRYEGYKPITNPDHLKYSSPKVEDHGFDGPVQITYADNWEIHQEKLLSASYEFGLPKNLDGNNGDSIGVNVVPATGYKGLRSTSKSAYLDNRPSNLEVVTNALATKILFDGKKAIGVVAGGKEYFAGKEVIISAGSLDSAKLLMLSGIGPKAELDRHDIPLLADLPVGVGLQDHLHVGMTVQVKDSFDNRAEWATADAMLASEKQFALDGTGPLGTVYNLGINGFFKGSKEVYSSPEFASLPEAMKEYIQKPTIPTWEYCMLEPPLVPGWDTTKAFMTIIAIGMVPQSRGTVTLKSSDPNDPPVSDPNFANHPFDRLTMIDGTRQCFRLLRSPIFAQDTIEDLVMPKSDSDEDIWTFIQQMGNSTWHPSSTVRMGKLDDTTAVVTSNFRVKGFEGLRVADVGVLPFMINCHTVSTAYYIGESAAERIITELCLNE
jgi:choline dehydrogenase-like flavoprotein